MPSLLRKKFANAVDGLDLIEIRPVAVMLEKHSINYEYQENVPYPFPNEIILKSIKAGVETISELSSFTGLDEDLVADFVTDEIAEGNVKIRSNRYSVTPQGEKLLDNVVKRVVKSKQESFAWDTVSGQLVRKPTRDRQLEDLQEQEPETVPLPSLRPTKPSKKVQRLKLSPEDLGGLYGSERAILRITKQRYVGDVWALPASLLIFSDARASHHEYRLVIGGEESEAHRDAVNSKEFRDWCSFEIEPQESPSDPSMLELEPLRRGAPQQFEDLQRVLPKVQIIPDEEPDAGAIVGGSGKSDISLVRQFSVFEHGPFLQEALLRSSRRLLIVSPWITSKVVNGEFEKSLTGLVEKGVEVDIIFGIKDDQRSSPEAIKRLCTMAKIYPNFRFYRHDNNHSKILISDDIVITTSFNWLSFRGDRGLTFRREEGTLVAGRSYADSYYSGWQSLVMTECTPACNS